MIGITCFSFELFCQAEQPKCPIYLLGVGGGGVFFIFNLALSRIFHLGGGLNSPYTPIVGRQNFTYTKQT